MVTNTTKLQDNLRELIDVLVDKSMWAFLTDKERDRVSKVIRDCMQDDE